MVQAARGSRPSSGDPTLASTVIPRSQLQGAGTTSAEILTRVPGVQVARSGGRNELSTAAIRGSTSAQTPVYLAGVRLNDDVTGTADLSTVPLWLLDSITVFRGHAPVNTDRFGMGGAIFMTPRLPTRAELAGGAELGSFGTQGGWTLGSVGDRNHGALLALRHDAAVNDYRYENNNGTLFDSSDDSDRARDNADYASNELWSISRHRFGRTRVTSVLHALDREQGSPGLLLIPAQRARTQIRRLLAAVSLRSPCSADGESCSFAVNTSALVAATTTFDPARELSVTSARTHNGGRRFSGNARLQLAPNDDWLVGLAWLQSSESLLVTRDESAIDSRRAQSRLAGDWRWGTGSPLSLHAVAAAECHTTRGPSSNATCGVLEPVGRVGARWHIAGPWSLLANLGRGVRVPPLAEMFGISPAVTGTAELRPESSWQGDIGVRLGNSRFDDLELSAELFGFARQSQDAINYRQNSFGSMAPYNLREARVLGTELALGATLLRNFRSDTALTLLDPRDLTTDGLVNDVMPFRSRMLLSQWLEVFSTEPAQMGLFEELSLGARYHYRSSRFADRAGLIVMAPNHNVDIEAVGKSEQWAVRFVWRNVLDSTQQDTVGFPLARRGVYASGEYWWR